jgi:hypothetical protein
LTSGGTFKWSKSNQTTVISSTVSSPGRGSCKTGDIERVVSGQVTGGNSTYTHLGDLVSLRMCQSGSGALSLVKGTKAIF